MRFYHFARFQQGSNSKQQQQPSKQASKQTQLAKHFYFILFLLTVQRITNKCPSWWTTEWTISRLLFFFTFLLLVCFIQFPIYYLPENYLVCPTIWNDSFIEINIKKNKVVNLLMCSIRHENLQKYANRKRTSKDQQVWKYLQFVTKNDENESGS